MIGEKAICLDTNYGIYQCNLFEIMNKNKMTIYKLSQLTGIKYDIIYNYCHNRMQRYDKDILAKISYVLDCAVSDLITYIPSEKQ